MINGRKIIGIIGGMGPMATADLFRKIIEMTDASCDNEHLHIIIDNNTDIPDRTASILSGSDAPLRYMTEAAERLTSCGADILIMPCNTSHYFYDRLCKSTSAPVINMIRETARLAHEKGCKKLGLLATDGTVQSGVYDAAFAPFGIELIKPDEEGQKKVMHMIYGEVKAGKKADTDALEPTLDSMEASGAEAFILGCTELPIAYASYEGRSFLDPTSILAAAAIKAAGGRLRSEV